MEISALDRANNTDRSNNSLAGAEADLFNQMLASLTEVDETYGDDEPTEDDSTEETNEARPADDNESADQPDQQLALLTQGQTDPNAASTNIGADTGVDTALSNGQQGKTTDQPATASGADTDQSATSSGADTDQAATTVNNGAEVAAVVQPTTVAQQRATTQTAKDNSQSTQEVETGSAEAGKASLRAGRDEAMAQGNGKLQGQPENNLAADKAKSAATTGEQTAQANQQTDRPATANEQNNQPQTARAETTAPELPKTLPPVPPTAPVAANTTPAPGPATNTPADQTTQLTANARPGEAQAVGTTKTAAANKPAQASRQQPPAQQIAVHVRNGLKAGADSIHVRLHPAELGRVEVRMQIDSDKSVQAVITVENAETMESLQRDSRMLQRALEDAGFKTNSDSFTFEQGESAPNEDGQTPGSNQMASGRSGEEGGELEADTNTNRRSSHDGIVDIEV